MKKLIILITGGKGGIARGIVKVLSSNPRLMTYAPNKSILDVTNYVQVKEYIQKIKPDILINNAGYIVPNKIKDISVEEWYKHVMVNLTGSFYCAKHALNNGCKTIINIGSTSSFGGRAEWGAYSACKASIISLTETLASEGVICLSLNPARTKSKMRKRLFPNEPQNTLMKPERIGEFVLKILNGDFANGSHIIVKKDSYYVLPARRGV